MRKVAAAMQIVFWPGNALAHSGHFSGESYGISHFVTDPFHLVISAVAISLYLVLRRVVVRRRSAALPEQ